MTWPPATHGDVSDAVGKLRATVFDVTDYGADGSDGSDDTTAITDAISAASAANGTVYFPPGNYNATTGSITVDVTTTALRGERARIDFTGSGNAITLTGSVNPPYEQAREVLHGLSLHGPGGAEGAGAAGVGIFVGNSSASGNGPSHTTISNCTIAGFSAGIRYGDHAYTNTWLACDIYNCLVGVDLPNTLSDAGERILFLGCVIFNSGTGIKNHHNGGSMMLIGCSVDYTPTFFDIADGRITCVGCHIESDDATHNGGYPIVLTGDAALTIYGGRFTDYTTTIPALVSNGSTGSGFILRDTQLDGIRTASGFLVDGTGWTDIDVTTLGNDNNTRVVQEAANLLSNGDFEQASLASDLVFITVDTATISSRTAGTNITLAVDTGQFHGGAQSLKATKVSSGVGQFIVAVPLPKPGIKMGASLWYSKPTSGANKTMYVGFRYGKIEQDASGLPVIVREAASPAGNTTVNFPNAALSWTQWALASGQLDRPPMWATHFWVVLNLDSVASDSVYFDDIVFTSGV